MAPTSVAMAKHDYLLIQNSTKDQLMYVPEVNIGEKLVITSFLEGLYAGLADEISTIVKVVENPGSVVKKLGDFTAIFLKERQIYWLEQ